MQASDRTDDFQGRDEFTAQLDAFNESLCEYYELRCEFHELLLMTEERSRRMRLQQG